MTSRQLRLASYPDGEVRPEHFRVVEVDLPPLRPGEVLVRNTWISIDPGLRLRLQERAPDGYWAALPLDAPVEGVPTVGEVVASRADGFAPGDAVMHAAGWRDCAIVEAGRAAIGGIGTLRRIDTGLAPPEAFLGVLGGTGLTAYAGMLHVAGLREGDVVWVSAAAGAVGSLAAQLAKLRGHQVIGSAGSDAKVRHLLDDLGLDAAFDHHAGPVRDLLGEAAPEGIDVYFDNVGGDHLEAALDVLRPHGRVAMCGTVSAYQAAEPPPGPPNLFLIVAKELVVRGLRGNSWSHLLPELWREVGAWVREGRIVVRQTVVDGLENAPVALARLLRGNTTGKTLVRIAT